MAATRCVRTAFLPVCVLTVVLSSVSGFYIPGVAPTEYNAKDKLDIKV